MPTSNKPKTSYGELLLRKIIAHYFPQEVPCYNHRPEFLINKKTGNRMELDIYLPGSRIAFEFNGLMHKLPLQKERDEQKKQICKKMNITLLSIKRDPANFFGRAEQIRQLFNFYPKLSDLPFSLQKKIQNYNPDGGSFFTTGQYVRAKKGQEMQIKIDTYKDAQKLETIRCLHKHLAKGWISQEEFNERMNKIT